MVQVSTLQFLKELEKNNNKPWFDANKKAYTAAKENIAELSQNVLNGLAKLEPAFGLIQPKDTMFRINRDIRFSADKSPYKTNMGISFNPQGKKAHGTGYYLHIQPGKSFAAAGIWMPETESLANIRQEIDYNFKDLHKILQAKTFTKYFRKGLSQNETLQRPPKGYEADNPAIDFIKLKSFVVSTDISDDEVTGKNFVKDLLDIFKAADPLNKFLQAALG